MKNLFFTTIGCLLFLMTHSQEFQISGTVSDNSNEPLPGANVYEINSNTGVNTDINGKYTLKVSSDTATIVFSFIGFQTQTIKIDRRSDINVVLQPNASLDEVVVTALNLERDSKDLGYAIQKLDKKAVSEVKAPNFVDNLAGQVAGVTVTQGPTGVGSSSKITIRGESSFTNNNPLFVVDGLPINNNTDFNLTNEAAAGFQEVDFGNGAMELAQEDIESISILKGPAAAALYGARAANGVVIITTKDGSENDGFGVEFNVSTFLDRPFRLPQFQNSYGQGNSGEFEYVDGLGGGINDNITYSWGPALDQGLNIAQFDSPVILPDGTVVRGGDTQLYDGQQISATPFVSNPDNLRNFYETGVTNMTNISVSNGFEGGSFRLSASNLLSESYIPGVNLRRNNISGRFNFSPSEKAKVYASLNYINSGSDNRPSNGYGSENINYSLVAWGPRSLNIESLEDYWQPGLEGQQQYSFNYTFFDNPYFILHENTNSFNRNRIFGNIGLNYELTEQLQLNINAGVDQSGELRQFRRHFSTNRFRNGAYAEQDVYFREFNTNALLTYSQEVEDWSFDISVGGNLMDQDRISKQTQTLALAQPGIFNFTNQASPIEVFQQEQNKHIQSVYAFAKVGYKDIVFLDITGRNDWSSALATPTSTDNVSFFYPSVAAAYIASNHLELPEWISFAKARASWAQVGNDTDPYQTAGAFVAGTPFNSQPTFTSQDFIANGNLLPEKTSAIELGADVRFFNDRLRLDVAYYNALTENQIVSFPVAVSSGYTNQVVNGGAVRSTGLEILLGVTPVSKEDFSWTSFFNFTTNKSVVEELPDGADKITLGFSRVYDNVNQTVWFQVEEGGEIGDMFGTGYLTNENGDFVLTEDGNFIADNTLRKIGNANPDFMLGWSNQFNYKNWELSFLLDWRHGGELVSRTLSLAGVGGQLEETENRPSEGIVAEGVVNVGTAENPVYEANTTAISAESYYRQFYDRNHEVNNVYNASYLKLRQFSLGYTFNSNKDTGFLQKGRTFRVAFIGRNVFAISEIPHFDPEQFAVQGNQILGGVEDMSYPTARSFGLKLSYQL